MNASSQNNNNNNNNNKSLEKVSLGFLIATAAIITAFLVVSLLNHFA